MTIGDLVIEKQGVGAAEIAFGFNGVDGILGIGPVDLTDGTTSSGVEIHTVLDTAFAAGTISANIIGVSFEHTTEASVTNGELTCDGVDENSVALVDILRVRDLAQCCDALYMCCCCHTY